MEYPLLAGRWTDFHLTKLPSIEKIYFKFHMYQCIFMVFHVSTFRDVSLMMQNPAMPQMYLCETSPASSGIPTVDWALSLLWFVKTKKSVLELFMHAQGINIKNIPVSY